MALEQERTSQRGGTKETNPGNFANDREKASEAGKKGGEKQTQWQLTMKFDLQQLGQLLVVAKLQQQQLQLQRHWD